MHPILLDFESRSRADLKKVGGRKYWEHPSSEALVVVWYDTMNGGAGLWFPGQQWPHVGRVLAAHNAHGFDRFGAERYGFGAADWVDTSQLARKAGLPGGLDALGQRWCGMPKDKEASEFTKSLSGVRRPVAKLIRRADPLEIMCPQCGVMVGSPCVGPKGKPRTPHKPRTADARARNEYSAGISADVWKTMSDADKRTYGVMPTLDAEGFGRVVRYCMSDVAIMVQAWPRLAYWLQYDVEAERADRVINDRGVCFDSVLARRLLVEDARCGDEAVQRAAVALGWEPGQVRAAARSVEQFCAVTGAENAQAATVETMDHPLAGARQALASIASGKLKAGLARVHADGRLRDTLRYCGAHTWRWSGKGMQLQNLPRPAKKFEDIDDPSKVTFPCVVVGKKNGRDVWGVDVDALAEMAIAGRHCDEDEIALLVRATICSPAGWLLVAQDFSSIEARATAWSAGDEAALAVFRSGKDPYKVAASAIFGVEYDAVTKPQRQVGKVAELACLAADTRVLTERGWVPIVDVQTSDRVWDGVAWVEHNGVVAQGDRRTIDVNGAYMTPDHLVWHCGWRPAHALTRREARHASSIEQKRQPRGVYWGKVVPRRAPGVEPVFDIAHAGPHNRFTILTDAGPLLVHNCGYQGGPGAFTKMAATYRIDLSALDTQDIVNKWRELHSPIRSLWYACERAFRAAVDGKRQTAGPCYFVHADVDDAVACFLPSGRPIVYHQPRVDEEGNISYLGAEKGREHIYGGKIVENLVQALCRDLMAEAVVRTEKAGMPVVLTVHDELVCEVPEAHAAAELERLHSLMLASPAWAAGLPVEASGWMGRRYRK